MPLDLQLLPVALCLILLWPALKIKKFYFRQLFSAYVVGTFLGWATTSYAIETVKDPTLELKNWSISFICHIHQMGFDYYIAIAALSFLHIIVAMGILCLIRFCVRKYSDEELRIVASNLWMGIVVLSSFYDTANNLYAILNNLEIFR